MKFKEKLPLIVGIGLPLLLIIFIFISVYLPSLLTKPQYNFIYTTGCNNYNYSISVVNGKITLTPRYNNNTYQYNSSIPQCFYLYDVKADSNRQISFKEAQTYNLNPTDKSPDGFIVTKGSGDSGGYFPFFWYGGYSQGYYLRGHGYNRKINDNDYDFQLLGWTQ